MDYISCSLCLLSLYSCQIINQIILLMTSAIYHFKTTYTVSSCCNLFPEHSWFILMFFFVPLKCSTVINMFICHLIVWAVSCVPTWLEQCLQMFCSTRCWTFVTCGPVLLTTCFFYQSDHFYCHTNWLHGFLWTGKCFLVVFFCSWSARKDSQWFPVEKMQTSVTLSGSVCGPTGWFLWDVSATGQSEVIYFLSAVAHACWKAPSTNFDEHSKTSRGQMSELQLVPHASLTATHINK